MVLQEIIALPWPLGFQIGIMWDVYKKWTKSPQKMSLVLCDNIVFPWTAKAPRQTPECCTPLNFQFLVCPLENLFGSFTMHCPMGNIYTYVKSWASTEDNKALVIEPLHTTVSPLYQLLFRMSARHHKWYLFGNPKVTEVKKCPWKSPWTHSTPPLPPSPKGAL